MSTRTVPGAKSVGLKCLPIFIFPNLLSVNLKCCSKAIVIENLNGGLEQTKVVVMELRSQKKSNHAMEG